MLQIESDSFLCDRTWSLREVALKPRPKYYEDLKHVVSSKKIPAIKLPRKRIADGKRID